jgi:hypothetical protein
MRAPLAPSVVAEAVQELPEPAPRESAEGAPRRASGETEGDRVRRQQLGRRKALIARRALAAHRAR